MACDQDQVDKITAKLSQAKSTTVDGLRVDQHSISDLIKAVQFCNDQASATSRSSRAWRLQAYKPPGAT